MSGVWKIDGTHTAVATLKRGKAPKGPCGGTVGQPARLCSFGPSMRLFTNAKEPIRAVDNILGFHWHRELFALETDSITM